MKKFAERQTARAYVRERRAIRSSVVTLFPEGGAEGREGEGDIFPGIPTTTRAQ